MPHRPIATAAALLAALLAALAVTGCDRRLEPWVEADEEPPPPAAPVRIPGLQAPRPSAEPLTAAPAGESIRGTVELGEGVAKPGAGVLFIIARSPAGGPPLAAKRLPPGPFPLRFEISSADAMLGAPLTGPILLTARIDADGDPLTRTPDELAASLDAPRNPGDSDVVLILRPLQ